jgi:hypothetical protein
LKTWAVITAHLVAVGLGPRDPHNVRRAFARTLKTARLPKHFTPHGLRHTFASILVAEGKSPAYVQAQLGHKSITLTVDTYARWLPKGDKAAIDSLDDATYTAGICTTGTDGDRVVTFDADTGSDDAKAESSPEQFRGVETSGPCWTRTSDPLLKRSDKGPATTGQDRPSPRPRRRWR